MLLIVGVACSPLDDSFESVQPPTGLEELDLGVRQQFALLWEEPAGDLPTAPETRRNWGELGQWFHVYRYYDSAARCYRNAITTDDADPRWPYLLGVLIAETGQPDDSKPYFETTLELAPDAHHARVRLGDVAREMGDLEQAEQRYREVLEFRPADAAARFGMAQLGLLRGDSAAALALLEPLAKEQPEASEVRYALGTAWRMAGDGARAATALAEVPADNSEQTTLRIDDPWMAELLRRDQGARLYTRKGIRAANRGLKGRAAEFFGAAIRLDPEGTEERINYALALSRLRYHGAAQEQIALALQLAAPGTDTHARARLEQARLLVYSGQPLLAEERLRALLADRANYDRARVELSRLLHTRGALELALTEYEGLRNHGADSVEVAFWHAASLLGLSRIDVARTQLEADLNRYSGEEKLRLLQLRSLAGATMAELEDIRAGLQWLVQLDPPISVLRAETMAMLFARVGDYDRACSWQQAVVDALAAAARPSSLQTARRRLTLYRERKPVATVWEVSERPVEDAVTVPYAATLSQP